MVRRHASFKHRAHPTTGMPAERKKYSGKRKIVLEQTPEGWSWTFYVGSVAKARSPKSYGNLGSASRTAYTFKAMLAEPAEVVPPPDHKYSGG